MPELFLFISLFSICVAIGEYASIVRIEAIRNDKTFRYRKREAFLFRKFFNKE